MSFLTTVLLALVATASAIPAPISPRASSGAYELIADYSGNTFFDHFTAFSGPDPTEGHVQYQTLQAAAEQKLVGLIYNTTSGNSTAYIGVDHTNAAPNGRNSVRLTSKQTFNAGSMAVIHVKHIPVQYGVWPAIWFLGSQGTWPESGESDLLEYVHEDTYNGMTLHTSPGCTVNNATAQQQGQLLNANCNAGDASTGCSVAAYSQNSFALSKSETKTFATAGSSFNAQGGGVYVHDWQADGITVWMFPRNHLPTDLLAGSPNPSSWTQKPLAKFSGSGCDFSSAFKDMQLIINIDFCGSWAGKVWESSGAAEKTGVATCNEYVANSPSYFNETYFDIASVKFFSNNGQTPGNGPTYSKRDEGEGVQYQNVSLPHCGSSNVTAASRNSNTRGNSTSSVHGTSSLHFGHHHHGSHPPFGNSTRHGHGHNCSNSTSFNFTASSNFTRGAILRNSDATLATSAASTTEVGSWLVAAGMFALFAFVA